MTAQRARWMAVSGAEEAQDLLLSAITHSDRWHEPAGRPLVVGLAARPESVGRAREFVREALCDWGLDLLIEDVELVISELVTNALRHALLHVQSSEPSKRPAIRLSLIRADGYLMCAVTDPSSAIPLRREPDYAAQTGRGLHLVEAFSRSWGWTPLRGAGKVVWAMFRTGP
jgi:anti-sigma regulatory factor (Ser/Thr protein kinase)